MKIAVISEVSAVNKNKAILEALEGYGHEVVNAGMKESEGEPELTYIETGFLGALLLNTKCVDYVVGGCGTGQGFINSIMQYPNVFAGLIAEPLDAWLFAQINGGNCISLALNKGYGWAGDINLIFIFEKFFSVEFGSGYPVHRKESQKKSRMILKDLSQSFHIPFESIVEMVNKDIIEKALTFPGIMEIIDVKSLVDAGIKNALIKRCEELNLKY